MFAKKLCEFVRHFDKKFQVSVILLIVWKVSVRRISTNILDIRFGNSMQKQVAVFNLTIFSSNQMLMKLQDSFWRNLPSNDMFLSHTFLTKISYFIRSFINMFPQSTLFCIANDFTVTFFYKYHTFRGSLQNEIMNTIFLVTAWESWSVYLKEYLSIITQFMSIMITQFSENFAILRNLFMSIMISPFERISLKWYKVHEHHDHTILRNLCNFMNLFMSIMINQFEKKLLEFKHEVWASWSVFLKEYQWKKQDQKESHDLHAHTLFRNFGCFLMYAWEWWSFNLTNISCKIKVRGMSTMNISKHRVV